jgi:antitoxin (DNA-binding transcriptional repressor) of toxin-antitoxin stability system
VKTITMLEFRRDAERIIRAVERGQRFLMTYRGRPVVHLEPVTPATEVREDDPIYHLASLADTKPGKSLTNEEIDAVLYDR